MSLLISGATIIDGIAKTPLEGQAIWVEAKRIRAIGKRETLNVPPSVQVVDARGKYVIPGLMDANVHLLGDIRMETLVRYEDRYEDLIEEAAQVALKAGVTTVFDTWGPRKPLMSVRDRIASGATPGSRIFCAGNIIGLDGPFSLDFLVKALDVASAALIQRINSLWVESTGPDLTWMTPEQVAAEVRAYLARGIDFVKYASSEHRGAEPNAFLVFSPLAQTRMVEEAHRAGLTAQAHTSSVEGLRVAIEAGCDLVQHCNITGPVLIPETTLEVMVKRGIGAVVFPFTQRRFDTIMEKAEAIVRRYFSMADSNCRNIIRSGAAILLATDAGILAPDFATDPVLKNSWIAAGEDNLGELGQGHFHWLKAMEEKGFPAIEGLRAATQNIAVAYGKDKDLGTLEPGKIADLIILDHNPLLAAENYRSIHLILKEGAIVNRETLPIKPILTAHRQPKPDSVASYGRYVISCSPSCC
jgi:imidazolonepropionase-like amidohydrolase